MPAITAHYLYALNVSQNLSTLVKKIIQENKAYFTLGAQGPDLLFYYKPYKKNEISTLGHTIHSKPAEEFFTNALKYSDNDQSLAYLLGTCCHYGLDRACHPFVDNFANFDSKQHASLEADFDSILMLEYGLKKVRCRYIPSIYEVSSISEVYGLPERIIENCTSGFRNFTKLVDRKRLIELGEFLGGKQGAFINLCLKDEPSFVREALVMHELFLNSINRTTELVEGIYSAARSGGDLPNDLKENFEGVLLA